jgi:hypothetical protein
MYPDSKLSDLPKGAGGGNTPSRYLAPVKRPAGDVVEGAIFELDLT